MIKSTYFTEMPAEEKQHVSQIFYANVKEGLRTVQLIYQS
jgi:hypothetical protein